MREETLSQADIRRYYVARVPKLHKVGSELRGPCPIHHGQRDSFAVEVASGRWFCHSQCACGGSIVDFEVALTGVDRKKARAEVIRLAGQVTPVHTARRTPNGRGETSLGRLVATYNYTNEAGEILYQCLRYEPKDFRQRQPDGRGGWIWKLDGVRLVLYRLSEIVTASIVFICEGEKDADALISLGVVATCNPMGAGKWRDEFSESLRGKEVYIIPDADTPGKRHAARIVESLTGVAKSVRLLVLPEAHDAAIWIEQGGTLEELLRLADEQSEPSQANGHPVPPISIESLSDQQQKKRHHFEVRPGGAVYFVEYVRTRDGEETESPTFVCSHLRIESYTRDAKSESWGRLLVWTDRDGREHRWAMPMELLAGDGTSLRETLLRGGLTIGTVSKARQLLLQYIQSERPESTAICVPQVGWYQRTYVFPDSAIPEATANEARVIYQSAGRGEHFYQTAGTLEEWKKGIGRRCAGNSRLVFAVSAAFAAPLLRPLNVEGGGFHLVGTSSTGKSTAQLVAGSVCGGGNGSYGFARSWRFTQNALEAVAELHNDGLLILDEIREVPDPKELDKTVYMLANGGGKGRQKENMTARRTLHWQLLFLSSGEIKLSEYAAVGASQVKAGAEVRLLNIPADAGQDNGVFEQINDADNARVFAEELKAASARVYGTALRAFLTCLVREWDACCAAAAQSMKEFVDSHLPRGAAPEVGRALRRIALVAAAGELATRMGITGWEPGTAKDAAARCFNDWITDRGGIGQADVEAGVRQVRAYIETHGSSRFQSILNREERVIERAGYWKDENGDRLYLVFPEAFKNEVCRGLNHTIIAKALVNKDLLSKGEKGNLMKKVRIPGADAPLRFYAIRAHILNPEGKEEEDPVLV